MHVNGVSEGKREERKLKEELLPCLSACPLLSTTFNFPSWERPRGLPWPARGRAGATRSTVRQPSSATKEEKLPTQTTTCMTLSSSPIPLHSTPYSSISPSHTSASSHNDPASYRTSHLYKLPRKHRASGQHELTGASTVGTAITLASVMATRNPSSAGKE